LEKAKLGDLQPNKCTAFRYTGTTHTEYTVSMKRQPRPPTTKSCK